MRGELRIPARPEYVSISKGGQKMAKTSWGASRFSYQAVAAKKAVSG
jgi:hypothetical protein